MIDPNIGYVIIETATTSQDFKPTIVRSMDKKRVVAEVIL